VGRGKVIADTSTADLLAAASGDRVIVRTSAPAQAAGVLSRAGGNAEVTGPDTLSVTGLAADRVVPLLTASAISFSEVSAQRATLEQAYLDLTRDVTDYRAQEAAR
jgi:ABC-2 type transport system ATP-binding protein